MVAIGMLVSDVRGLIVGVVYDDCNRGDSYKVYWADGKIDHIFSDNIRILRECYIDNVWRKVHESET